jgi:hypothetical protein
MPSRAPAQIRSTVTPERGCFLLRPDRELAVEFSDIPLAQESIRLLRMLIPASRSAVSAVPGPEVPF